MITKLSEILAPSFKEIHHAIKAGTHNEFVLKGGRGSTKSSYVSIEMILQLIKHPDLHAVVMRKVANTMRTTVYAQYVWAITELGLYNDFKLTVSPMEITYKRTGQKIMFFGADDPGKVKSIKVPFGYIGLLHFEELDQFAGENEIRNLEQSILRGGAISIEFKSFNPPKTAANWANKYCLNDKPGQIIHHSTYEAVSRDWLGSKFLSDAEWLRENNPEAYEHEYLGVPNGNGGLVFDNLELRTITDEEVSRFDRIYQGIDFGWYPDPFAFIRLHYDKARETIYFIDEIYANKLTNEVSASMIKSKGYTDAYIVCDSAEPKSISDLQTLKLRVQAAVKGPGSVDYSMKWLQRRKIVIDRRRTPHAYDEFVNYEYERNKDGDIISGYPDKDNHLIDSTRYALERVYRKKAITA